MGVGCHQILFSEYVCMCVYLFIWLKAKILCSPAPLFAGGKRDYKTTRAMRVISLDQTRTFRRFQRVKAASCCASLTLKGPWSEAIGKTLGPPLSFLVFHTMSAICSVFLKSGALAFPFLDWQLLSEKEASLAFLCVWHSFCRTLSLTLFIRGSPIQMLFRGQQGRVWSWAKEVREEVLYFCKEL